MKKFGLVLILMLVAGVLVLPHISQAGLLTQSQCSSSWGINCSTSTSVTGIITMILDIVLSVAGLVAVLFIVIGGYQYVVSGGNEEMAERGKKTLLNAIIGIVIIILSFVVVRVVSNLLSQTST